MPLANSDQYIFDEDSTNMILNLTENDSYSGSISNIEITQQPNNGHITVNGETVIFNAHSDIYGKSDFSYRITEDSELQSLTATSSIMLVNINDAPVTQDDALSVTSDLTTLVNILKNDTDEQLSKIKINIHTQPSFGTLTVNNDKVHYTLTDLAQNQDSFSYSITDKAGLESNVSTVILLVTNQLPLATTNPDELTIKVNTKKPVNVLLNDTLYSDTYTLSITESASSGTASVEDNILYYEADTNTGQDSFSYTITDEHSQMSAPATVTINKSSTTPLLAIDDNTSLHANDSISINVIANDEYETIATLELFTDATLGKVTKQADNLILYQASSRSDSFVYRITDSLGNTQYAQVYIDIAQEPEVIVDIDATEPDNSQAQPEKPIVTSVKSGGGGMLYLLLLFSLLLFNSPKGMKGRRYE